MNKASFSSNRSYLEVTQQDVEREVLKRFLANKGVQFCLELIEKGAAEPTDIRYAGISYQITEGDKEQVQSRRREIYKEGGSLTVASTLDLPERLLRRTLEKKEVRSDSEIVLLIDLMSKGALSDQELSKEVSNWANNNRNLCECWKEIYLVYRGKNVKVGI